MQAFAVVGGIDELADVAAGMIDDRIGLAVHFFGLGVIIWVGDAAHADGDGAFVEWLEALSGPLLDRQKRGPKAKVDN